MTNFLPFRVYQVPCSFLGTFANPLSPLTPYLSEVIEAPTVVLTANFLTAVLLSFLFK